MTILKDPRNAVLVYRPEAFKLPVFAGDGESSPEAEKSKTLGEVLKQMPQKNDQDWSHAARVARWAAQSLEQAKNNQVR